jgi:hypothetical protein
MGGAVVGGAKDNSDIFYNPGALGFTDTRSISINANVYQSENIRIYNALGQKKDFKSSSLGTIPLLVAGMLPGKGKLKIGYGLLSPVDFSFNATARIDGFLPVVDDAESPGPEEFIGQASISSRLKEVVADIAFGYKLSDHWSIGVANLFSVRTLTLSKATYSRMYLNEPGSPLVTSSFVRSAEYYHVRYSAKIALAYRKNNFSAGLTVTTPSLGLFGSGTIAADVLGTNMLFNGSRTDLLLNDRQDKLKAGYKSPFSAASGCNWTVRRSSINIAFMYYAGLGVYDILRAQPSAFARPAALYTSLGSDQFLRLKDGAKPVINIALGYEYALKPNMVLDASIRTNQSYYDPDINKSVGIKSEISTWDIYHFTLGTTMTNNRNKISLGIMYSKGIDNARVQDGNLQNPGEGNFLQGSTIITKASYSSIGLLLGYTLTFKGS